MSRHVVSTKNGTLVSYNKYMETIKYHLLKKKYPKTSPKRGKTFFIAGLPSKDRSPDGKLKYNKMITIHTGNESEARRIAQEELAKIFPTINKENIESFLTEFWQYDSEYFIGRRAEGFHITTSYISQSLQLLRKYFIPWAKENGVIVLSDLSKQKLFAWRAWAIKLIESRGHSMSRVNNVRLALNVPLTWLVELDRLTVNPLTAVHRVKEIKISRIPFEKAELEKMYTASWPDQRAKIAAMLAATTGARLGELQGLRWISVHLDDGYINILEQYQPNCDRRLCPPKCGSVRENVPLPDALVFALKKYRNNSPRPANPFVLYGTNNFVPITRCVLNTALVKGIEASGVELLGRSFHCFRHSYVSQLRSQVGLEITSHSVGHTDSATTKRYDHQTDEELIQIKRAVNGMIEAVS